VIMIHVRLFLRKEVNGRMACVAATQAQHVRPALPIRIRLGAGNRLEAGCGVRIPHRGGGPAEVWCLLRSLYGLRQAPRLFWRGLCTTSQANGRNEIHMWRLMCGARRRRAGVGGQLGYKRCDSKA